MVMHRPMPELRDRTWRSSARRGSLSMVLWVFGLSTTLLLVGLWGRAVTNDIPVVQEATRAAVDAEIASDRIYSWIEEGVAASVAVDSATAEGLISDLRDHPEVEAAVGAVIDEFIDALFTADGDVTTVELTETLGPVVPLVASELSARQVAVDEATLNAALADAEIVGLTTGEMGTVVRVVDDARSLLSAVVALSALTLVVAGSSAVRLSEDRLLMVRMLAIRVVFSAMSFAVLFRVGSWALDPDGGGSPFARSGSVLIGSNADVFLLIGAAAAGVSGAIGWVIWRRRVDAGEGGRAQDSDADTKELVRV